LIKQGKNNINYNVSFYFGKRLPKLNIMNKLLLLITIILLFGCNDKQSFNTSPAQSELLREAVDRGRVFMRTMGKCFGVGMMKVGILIFQDGP
jgi:uncharacterized lipoprotein YajG